VKTEAHCPTCDFPFSFWRLVFGMNPFHLYCYTCHSRIDIEATKFMWAAFVGLVAITVVLSKFIIAHNWSRLLVLAILWLILAFILDIVIAVMMVNLAQISKPDDES